MLNALVDEFQRKVVYKFKELNLLEEEYVLLKLVMLFTTTQLMCDESSEIVRRLRNKYEQLLLQYIKDSRQDLEPDKVANRVADIFDILAHLIVKSADDGRRDYGVILCITAVGYTLTPITLSLGDIQLFFIPITPHYLIVNLLTISLDGTGTRNYFQHCTLSVSPVLLFLANVIEQCYTQYQTITVSIINE
uniref:NR LBD domain-containing protein n=1 Tax=Heterorhabditis bacteriophora TaxID=37862 RepID=A0A1I7XA15_HETBA